MALTDKEKKSRSRQKMRELGFTEILIKCHLDDVKAVRDFVSVLNKKRDWEISGTNPKKT